MIDRAALSRSAVSSTTTGGTPRPAPPGLLGADAADALDGLAAIIQAARLKLLLGFGSSGDGTIHVLEHAPVPGVPIRGPGGPLAHVAQDFLHNAANQFIADL